MDGGIEIFRTERNHELLRACKTLEDAGIPHWAEEKRDHSQSWDLERAQGALLYLSVFVASDHADAGAQALEQRSVLSTVTAHEMLEPVTSQRPTWADVKRAALVTLSVALVGAALVWVVGRAC